MIIEILYAGLLEVDVVPHREGNVLKLGLTHYDGTHQVGFLDVDHVDKLYKALGDVLIASSAEREKARQSRFEAFINGEDTHDSDY
jgi:hypothetical protein